MRVAKLLSRNVAAAPLDPHASGATAQWAATGKIAKLEGPPQQRKSTAEQSTAPPTSPQLTHTHPPPPLLRPGIGDLIADDRTMMIINDIMNKAKEDVKKLIEKVQVRRRPVGRMLGRGHVCLWAGGGARVGSGASYVAAALQGGRSPPRRRSTSCTCAACVHSNKPDG